MIARDAIYTPLHRIDEKTTTSATLPNLTAEISLGRKRLLGLLVPHEFDSPQQTQATDIAHDVQIAQAFEGSLQG